jgi:two-component system sensor histidine kinase DegS
MPSGKVGLPSKMCPDRPSSRNADAPLARRPEQGRWRKTVSSLPFWTVLALLVITTSLHYLTPQLRLLPFSSNTFLSRHTVERIAFILPVAVATFAFRQRGGLIVLALAFVAMAPRAIWLSPYRADALIETGVTVGVGYFVTWLIEVQARERTLREAAVARLSALNAVGTILTQSLELGQILEAALDKVLEVIGLDAGLVFTVDRGSQELILAACRGVSEGSAEELGRLGIGEGLCGRAAQRGEVQIVGDGAQGSSALGRVGMRTQVAVPLKARQRTQGVLAVGTRDTRQFSPQELELLGAIGNEIGVAIENAQLYDRMRFYASEITRAQEEERRRIARELHDETLQMLILLSRRLEALASPTEPLPETTTARLKSLQELVRDAMRAMRRFVQALRPPALDHLGLEAAIRGLLADLPRKGGIRTEFRVIGESKRLPPESELALFRIAQEALHNASRHADASRVSVQLAFRPDGVRVMVQDDGHGFEAPERLDDLVSLHKFGLMGMAERARVLGGTLTVQSKPGRGTDVIAELPAQPGP